MDLSQTTIPKSDQWNADDLIGGPVTVTVDRVTKGTGEQPANVHLIETPSRAYRPSKSMRRVMVAGWGKESDAYTGRRLTLFLNPELKFGGVKVGGIEIAAMSHIDTPLTLMLTRSKGRREPFTVEPLANATPAPTEPTAEQVAASTDAAALRSMWQASGVERRAQIEARVSELNAHELAVEK